MHPSDYANSFADIRMWHEIDTTTQELVAIRMQHFAWNTTALDLDGRTAASARHGRAHVDGLLDGRVGRQHAEGDDDASEGRLVAAQRRRAQRRATVTEHFIRHGNHLTWSVFVQDPKYLEEPFFRNRDYTLAENGSIGAYPCESVVEVVLPEQGYFPHYLPGENPFLIEYARNHKIPYEAAMGGAATMYPEYRKKMAELPQP